MIRNYNIFYKEKKSANVIKLDKSLIKDDILDDDWKRKITFLNKCITSCIRESDLLLECEEQRLFLLSFKTLLLQKTIYDVLSFLNIKEAIDYVFKEYSVAFCNTCSQEATLFNKELLKTILKKRFLEDSLVLISFKVENIPFDYLEKKGIQKIIKNGQLRTLTNDELKYDNVYAVFKTLKLTHNILRDDEKLDKFLESVYELKDCSINVSIYNKNSEKLDSLLDFDLCDFICPKCYKKLKSFDDREVDGEYIYQGIKYSSLINGKLSYIYEILDDKLKMNSFLGREVLSGIFTRVSFIEKFDNIDLLANIKVNMLSFYDYLKLVLSIILETLPKDYTLVIKDIFDYLNINDKKSLITMLNENFEDYCILSKCEINAPHQESFSPFNDNNFFMIQEKLFNKKLIYVGDFNNLYKKIVNFFISAAVMQSSDISAKDFSYAKINMLFAGKMDNKLLMEYKVLGYNFFELIKMSLKELKNVFGNFKNIHTDIDKLCKLGLGDAYLFTNISSVPLLISYC